MIKKITLLATLSLLAALVIGGLIGPNDGVEDVVVDDELLSYYDEIDENIFERYDFTVEDLTKLGVDIDENDYQTNEEKEYIIVLDASPARIQMDSGFIGTSNDINNSINDVFDQFYDSVNVDQEFGMGELGFIDFDSEYDITISNEYYNSIVAVSATMPAEYIFYLIGLPEVNFVFENTTIQIEPALDAAEFAIPDEYLDQDVIALIHQTRGYLGVEGINSGDWLGGIALDGTGVNVAVMDSGIDWTHPDLTPAIAGYYPGVDTSGGWQDSDNSWLEGWGHRDFSEGGFDPMEATPEDYFTQKDEYGETGQNPTCSPLMEYFTTGHGTHVTGTIAGQGVVENVDNVEGRKSIGMAKGATIFGVRTLGACGSGTILAFIDGVEHVARFTYQDLIDGTAGKPNAFDWDAYVAEEVARGRSIDTLSKDNLVIDAVNMSLGGGSSLPTELFNIVVDNLSDLGIVVVAAAGNAGYYGMFSTQAPGASDKVITVGAAPIDYYVETVDIELNGSESTLNVFAYGSNDNINNLITDTLNGKEVVFVETGTNRDYLGANVNNKVVLVDRGDINFFSKYLLALENGADAMIIVNYEAYGADPIYEYYGELNAFSIPLYTVDAAQGAGIKAAIESAPNDTIVVGDINSDLTGQKLRLSNASMAGFSSLGPSYGTFNIKPDIVAPGVNIYATVPNFYGKGLEQEYATLEESYTVMQGTSMAAPHVTGIVALMIENYRYNLGTWDDSEQLTKPMRTQNLKVDLMNTANHDIYSQGEYDVNTYEITDYSVFKRTTGLLNPQRAIQAATESSVYVHYSQRYAYLDSSKAGSLSGESILNINNVRTGLISYGLIIGNSENEASLFDYDWSSRAVTIDNTVCTDATDDYYYIDYQSNQSKYSEDPSTLKYTVSEIVGDENSTSSTIGVVDQTNFNNGSIQEYFISGSNLMYIHVPCGEKVEVTIELAQMGINAENGYYEGYFNFNKVTPDVSGELTLYQPYSYDFSDPVNSPKMTFSPVKYGVGDDVSDINGYENVTSSLPFAFNYAQPGADFGFYWPFTTTKNQMNLSGLSGTFYSDFENPVRFYVNRAMYDDNGDPIIVDGKHQTEHVGMLPSFEVPKGFYKGLRFSTARFFTRTLYSGGLCDIEPNGDVNDMTFFEDDVPEGCENKFAEHGLYEFEAHFDYYDPLKDEVVTEIQDEIWFYLNDEGPETKFGYVEDRGTDIEPEPQQYTYFEPGLYEVGENDFDSDGYIWIKGYVFDEGIEIMKNYEPQLMNERRINQSRNKIKVHVNGSLFPIFEPTIEDDGSFEIGIHKTDVLGGSTKLLLRPENLVQVFKVGEYPEFTFVDNETTYYTWKSNSDNYEMKDVQGVMIKANNFQQIVKGAFGVRLNSACDITEIKLSEELTSLIENNNLEIDIQYNISQTSHSRLEWELTGEDFYGISGDMDLFEIITTEVCESKLYGSFALGLPTSTIDETYLYDQQDVLGNTYNIRAIGTNSYDKETYISKTAYIKYDKSAIVINIASLYQNYANGSAGLKMRVISPNGEIYNSVYGSAPNSIHVEPVDGIYVVELESPGMLPAKFSYELEHQIDDDGNPIVQTFRWASGTFTGIHGDINNDGLIDVRDAYYLLILDDDKSGITQIGAHLHEQYALSMFGQIKNNFGKSSYNYPGEPEILEEFGGLTMFDIALKLGFGQYFESGSFPKYDKVTTDPTVDYIFEANGCYAITEVHKMFEEDKIFNQIDGLLGEKDELLSTCELNTVTSFHITDAYKSGTSIASTAYRMWNLLEITVENNNGGGLGSALANKKAMTKIQLNNTGVNEYEVYNLTNDKQELKTVILRDNNIRTLRYNLIHHLTQNVETLDLSGNYLTSLKGIENTSQIKYLYLRDNAITDLSGIEELFHLEILDLRGNEVHDLEPLRGLSNLKILLLDDNQIVDLEPIGDLNLQILSVKNNKLTTIEPVSEMGLEVLNVAFNNLTDSMEFSKLLTLKNLYIQNNKLTEIKGLKYLGSLKELNITDNIINFSKESSNKTIWDQINQNAEHGLMTLGIRQLPIIDLINEEVSVVVGEEYEDQRGIIIFGGGIMKSSTWYNEVIIEGLDSVDTSVVGTYEITYKVSIGGLVSETYTRTVHVIEKDQADGIGTFLD